MYSIPSYQGTRPACGVCQLYGFVLKFQISMRIRGPNFLFERSLWIMQSPLVPIIEETDCTEWIAEGMLDWPETLQDRAAKCCMFGFKT